MSTLRREGKAARRRARLARRGPRHAYSEEISDKMLNLLNLNQSPDAIDLPRGLSLDPVDARLDQTLHARGWTVFERHVHGDVYDWPAALNEDHTECTYCIVWAPDRGEVEECRVHTVNGDRFIFETIDAFLAEIEPLEATRHEDRQRH